MPLRIGPQVQTVCFEKDEKAASAERAKAAAAAVETPEPTEETAAAKPKRAPKPETNQPWRATTNRGYIPRARTPRKVGGS